MKTPARCCLNEEGNFKSTENNTYFKLHGSGMQQISTNTREYQYLLEVVLNELERVEQ